MLRWYWYLCGAAYARETALLHRHQPEDYERWHTTLAVPEAPESFGGIGANPEPLHARGRRPPQGPSRQ
jgi:hypothetical protein